MYSVRFQDQDRLQSWPNSFAHWCGRECSIRTAFYSRSPNLLISSKLQMLRPLPEGFAQPRSAANVTMVGRHSWSQPLGQGPLSIVACSCFWPSPSPQVGSGLSSGFLSGSLSSTWFLCWTSTLSSTPPHLVGPWPLSHLSLPRGYVLQTADLLLPGSLWQLERSLTESTTVPPSVWSQVLSTTWVWLLLRPPTGP